MNLRLRGRLRAGEEIEIAALVGLRDVLLVERAEAALEVGHGPLPRAWATRELVTGFDNAWSLIDATDGTLWFATNQDAPRYKVVALNAAIPGATCTVMSAVRVPIRSALPGNVSM